MIPALPLFHRIAGQKVVVVGEGEMGEAKLRLVQRAGGIPVSEAEASQARLAFIALDNPREADKAALRLKRLGLLVNVADRPELCDFTTPSILDRAPVLIAVGTDGASAGLAKQIRLRLETILPQSLGTLAKRLFEARDAIRHRWPEGRERRQAIDEALGEGGVCDVLDPEAADRVSDWIAGGSSVATVTSATIVLRSDDPDDLTLREARLLGQADLIIHDADVPLAILTRARADAARRLLTEEQAKEAFPTGTTVRLCSFSASQARGASVAK